MRSGHGTAIEPHLVHGERRASECRAGATLCRRHTLALAKIARLRRCEHEWQNWYLRPFVDLVWTCCILQLLFASCGPQQRELCASENTKIVTWEE
jgi:hypothetical protein